MPRALSRKAAAREQERLEVQREMEFIMKELNPLSAERVARGDTRMIMVKAEGAFWKILFVSTDGQTGESSMVEATRRQKTL